ncbi:MAG: IS21 family transposase [Dehalococcoidia bacterium]
MELFERIRRDRRKEGLSIRTLSRRHGVHRRTVRQALVSALPPPRVVPPRAAPALGPWKATIRAWLTDDLTAPRKQRHTARRVWQRLFDEHGAEVGESTVRAYVSEVRRELLSGATVVTIIALHPPGEEAEVDFGAATVILAGEPTIVHIFHLRLSCSGKAVHVPFLIEDQTAFLEGFAVAFERLGGVPGRVRLDNLKAAVARILEGRDRIESERFTLLRSHYGFDRFSCLSGQAGAHEKGGVEGEVGRFRRRHLVPVPEVATFAELEALFEAADRADDARRIEGRRETVAEAFERERPSLRALPDAPFDAAADFGASVDRKSRVRVRSGHYSVPVRLAGREVRVRLGARWVELSHGGLLVARHARHARKGEQTLTLDHYLEVLLRKPGALPGSLTLAQARESGAFTSAHERFWRRARRKGGDAAGTRALIEVLLLHRSLPFVAVHAALDAVERVRSADPGLVAIEARRIADGGDRPVVGDGHHERAGWARPVPALTDYDALLDTGPAR